MKEKILVIGAGGMLGNAQMSKLSKYKDFAVFGTVRNFEEVKFLPSKITKQIKLDIDVENIDSLIKVFNDINPNIVINCVGFVKEPKSNNELATAIYLNSLFPHRLASLAEAFKARLIHISTDSVFSGKKGNYRESDIADAEDIYSRTKFLGEVQSPHCLTLRTSIIGHGLQNHDSLIDWFLAQRGRVKGYTKVIYSGFPTAEIARIIAEYIIPNRRLHGIYHLSSEAISKYDLLKLVARIYHKKIAIDPFDDIILNRSLDSKKFQKMTSYQPPSWEQLIRKMYKYYKSNSSFIKY